MSIRNDQYNTINMFHKENNHGFNTQIANKQSGKEEKPERTMIYAGDLNLVQDQPAMIKLQAQKKAMKAIMDQYENEKNIDDGILMRKEHQKELSADTEMASNEIKNLRMQRLELKDTYGVTDDSEEQVNLELLEKSIYGSEELTEEEMKQLENMGPLTDYQKGATRYRAMEQIWLQRIDEGVAGIQNENRAITSIQLAKLKTHPMVDAQKEAAKIIETATKQVIGTFVQEGKDTVDKELEEKVEEARDRKEKEQEDKEKLQAIKEKKEQNVTTNATAATDSTSATTVNNTNQMNETALIQEELLTDLKTIALKQNMLQEDVKGIVVDETI